MCARTTSTSRPGRWPEVTQLTRTDRTPPSTARPTGSTKKSSASATDSAGARTAARSRIGSSTRRASASSRWSTTRSRSIRSITRIPYPKVGTTNSAVRIGVVSADGGETRWMQTPGDPQQSTILRGSSGSIAQTLAIQQLNRLQNQNDFLLADARTGTVTRAFRDESKTWVEVHDDVRWIDDGRAFLWIERARRLAACLSRTARRHAARLITRFEADVIDIAGLDERSGWLYFLASPATRRSATSIDRTSMAAGLRSA